MMKKLLYFLLIIGVLYGVHRLVVHLEYARIPKVILTDKKAIVVGATSGIGRQVAKLLAKDGYKLGLIGRRRHLLESLKNEIKTDSFIKQIDVSDVNVAKKQFEELIREMGGLDLIVISVSAQGDTGSLTPTSKMSWEEVKKFIDVDLNGFWVAAHTAIKQFEKQGHGHIVGVSSVDKVKGSPHAPEYSGAKAFIAKYLDGMRNRMMQKKLPIFVTEVIPGWVDVERQTYTGLDGTFWVATAQEAAKQIVDAIKKKKEKAYITKRWGLIAFLFWIMPDWLYRRL